MMYVVFTKPVEQKQRIRNSTVADSKSGIRDVYSHRIATICEYILKLYISVSFFLMQDINHSIHCLCDNTGEGSSSNLHFRSIFQLHPEWSRVAYVRVQIRLTSLRTCYIWHNINTSQRFGMSFRRGQSGNLGLCS